MNRRIRSASGPWGLSIALALGFALSASLACAAAHPQAGEFQGTWKLDPAKSERLGDKLEAMKRGPARPDVPGAGVGTGREGGMGQGGGSSEGGSGDEPAETLPPESAPEELDPESEAALSALAQPVEVLEIRAVPSGLELRSGDSLIRVLELEHAPRTPGRKERGGEARGDDAAPRWSASWKGQRLVAESPERRSGLKESYQLSRDGRTLVVFIRVGAPGRPSLELRRVYERAPKP